MDSVYVKFFAHNIEVFHHHHVCKCGLIKSIHTKFVGIFMSCLHSTFHMPSFISSLVITIKLETNCHTSFQDPILSGINVICTSQVHVSAILFLLVVGN